MLINGGGGGCTDGVVSSSNGGGGGGGNSYYTSVLVFLLLVLSLSLFLKKNSNAILILKAQFMTVLFKVSHLLCSYVGYKPPKVKYYVWFVRGKISI